MENWHSRLEQKKFFLPSSTSEPQRGHFPITSLCWNREVSALTALYWATRSDTICSMPPINASGACSPRSTDFKPASHWAVSLADFTLSGSTTIRLNPFFVGRSCLPLRSRKPPRTSFSSTPARVAGVPRPVRSAPSISANSSALACSIADKSRSSVKCRGGLVVPSLVEASTFSKVCPSASGGRALASSSLESSSGFFFSVAKKACSTALKPGDTTTRPFAVKVTPPQRRTAVVSS